MKLEASLAWRPQVATWEVTRACDPHELTAAEGHRLILQLSALDPGLVVLTGDDPFKRPDLFPLIEDAVAKGLRLAIAPSVMPRFTAEVVRRLGVLGVHRVALGVDGPDAAAHDQFRGAEGSFVAMRATLAAVRAEGMPLQIDTSLTRCTVEDLPRTADLIAEITPELWSVRFVVPVGRARCEHQLGPDACERVFHFLYEWSKRTRMTVQTTAAPAYRRVALQARAIDREPGRPADRPLAVNDGKGLLFVSHTGDVYPSDLLPLRAGNVRETALQDLYRRSRLFRALRDPWRLEGKCGYCPFRSVCGGSRARAFATSGSFLAEDPACVYHPRRGEG